MFETPKRFTNHYFQNNKYMKKTIFTMLCFLLIFGLAKAQDYGTGVGIRGGFSQGLTLKHFLDESDAVEGILAWNNGGFVITGLYEIHKPAFDTPGLNWYYGFGGHVGFWNNYSGSRWWGEGGNHSLIGIDGILGIEYSFEEIPINLSLDWKPAINIIGHTGVWGDSGALSIRYIF